ncbi:MAG: porin family protein [Treponema sp.]|jgi:hypothetical protein|nr:porin family protein [Treponema sp.]
MAKKSLLVLVLAAIVAGGAFAQEAKWYNSYAPGIDGSNLLVNVGIGFGILPYKMSLPPISASIEYAGLKIPLSIGGYFGIAGYDEDVGFTNYSATMTGFGARAAWHFGLLENLDTYVGLNLGWMIYSQKVHTPEIKNSYGGTPAIDTENDLSAFFYGFNIGARYFFTKNIGVYVELGYSAISVASAGLSLKF